MSILLKYGFSTLAFLTAFGVFVYFFNVLNPLFFLPDQCVFSGNAIKCLSHSIENGTIELLLENPAGKDIIIEDIMAISAMLAGGNCSLDDSALNSRLNKGTKSRFILNKSADGSQCAYNSSVGKSRYDVKISYHLVGPTHINRALDGKLII